MISEHDILEEYKLESSSISWFYITIITLLASFSIFIFLDQFFDFENFSRKISDKDLSGFWFILLVPVIALILFIFKKKSGWVIACLYCSFIALAGIGTEFYNALQNEEYPFIRYLQFRQLFILAATFTVTALLLTNNVRAAFKIKKHTWIITISISTGLAFLLIYIER